MNNKDLFFPQTALYMGRKKEKKILTIFFFKYILHLKGLSKFFMFEFEVKYLIIFQIKSTISIPVTDCYILLPLVRNDFSTKDTSFSFTVHDLGCFAFKEVFFITSVIKTDSLTGTQKDE